MLKTRDLIKLKQSLRGTSSVTFPDPADFPADIDKRFELLALKLKNIKIKVSQNSNIACKLAKLRSFDMQTAN